MSFGTSFAPTTRPLVMGRSHAVVSGHHLSTAIGMEALRAGGNAIDAAIAAAAALAVLKPDASGIGSDLFLLYAPAGSDDVHALNACGPAPALAVREAFGEGAMDELGIRSVSVPGAVAGWEAALGRFGRRSLSQALAPAIALARDGMPVSAYFAATLAANEKKLRPFAATRAVFYPDGAVPRFGDILVQSDAARTLDDIARGGARAFYRGRFAEALDAFSRREDGLLRAGDLDGEIAQWRPSLRVPYRDLELVAQPPVSVGIVVPEAMAILAHLPAAAEGDPSAGFIHRTVEALKLALADLRAYVGDPDAVASVPLAELLDPRYAARRAEAFDPATARAYAAGLAAAGSETSFVGVIDAEGSAVSLLQSVYHIFGSGVVVPETGVVLNDRMLGFSLDPSSPNVVAPRKRPLNTLNPLIVRQNGRTRAVLGTPGGPSQVATNAILLQRLFDLGMEPQRAVDGPRWFVTPSGELDVEEAIGDGAIDGLRARGHDVAVFPPCTAAFGDAGIITVDERGVRSAAADPRRESYALAL